MATSDKTDKTDKNAGTLDSCPECGVSMEGRDPKKHSYKHYGERNVDARLYPDAAKKQQQLRGEG